MEKIKIVFLVTRLKKAGPINQTLYIIKALDRKVFEPYVISLLPEIKNDSLEEKFIALGTKRICVGESKVSLLTGKSLKLKKIFSEIKPDLVHSVGMGPYKISLNYKKESSITTVRNYFFEDYPAKYGKILGRFLAKRDLKLLKSNDYNVTCSKSLSKIYKKNHDIDLKYIRNGVDLDFFDEANISLKNKLREKLDLPHNKKIGVYTGQFVDRKNQSFAIESLLENKGKHNTMFIFVGGGKNFEKIKGKHEKESMFLFTGQVNNVKDYLQAADFYFSSSKSEGLPNGVLEAMAVGLPLLLSNIEQHMEIYAINNSIGEVFENGSKNDFNVKLDKLMAADLQEISIKSRQTVKEYLSATQMSLHYQEYYLKRLKLSEEIKQVD